jgi:site-specific DNA recombinase
MRFSLHIREQGIVTKVRPLKTGRTVGGITRGLLAHFLRNRFYIGEVLISSQVVRAASRLS